MTIKLMIKYSIRLKIDLRVGAIIMDLLQLMISPRNIIKNLAVFYTEVRSVHPHFLRNAQGSEVNLVLGG